MPRERRAPLFGVPPTRRPARPALGPPRRFPRSYDLCKERTKAAPVSGRRVPRSTAAQRGKARSGFPRSAPVSRAAARGERRPRRDGEGLRQEPRCGVEAAGSSPRGWRLRLRARWEPRQETALCGRRRTALKVSETPGAVSPQCPGATPSPLEDPGTMPKFGGNWGQCPVVFLDAGEGLPTSWRTRSRAKCAWGRRNSANPRGSGTFVGDTEKPEIRARPARDWGLRRAAGGPRTMPEIRDEPQLCLICRPRE